MIVRHGETEWSREGRHTGRTDLPLTAKGREQAERLRPALQARRFTAVFCSPLQRARDTCALAGFHDGVVYDPDLEEWDYGRYDGLTLSEIRARRPGWSLWRDGSPGGEQLAAVAQRADRVLERVRALAGDVLLFAHGHVLRVVTARWLELDPTAGQRFVLDPAAPCDLGHEHDWTALRAWNVTPG